jgi:hypothetical protein
MRKTSANRITAYDFKPLSIVIYFKYTILLHEAYLRKQLWEKYETFP